MGKTASGAVWLDPNKTSPFDFYQYWRNVGDEDVIKCLKMLTFLPLEEIEKMEKWEGSELNKAKEILAYELTELVHGEDEADKAKEAASALFKGKGSKENMPSTDIEKSEINDGISLLDLMLKAELIPSKSEGRRLVKQGGVSVDDIKITDVNKMITLEDFKENEIIIKKGKKVYHKINIV